MESTCSLSVAGSKLAFSPTAKRFSPIVHNAPLFAGRHIREMALTIKACRRTLARFSFLILFWARSASAFSEWCVYLANPRARAA